MLYYITFTVNIYVWPNFISLGVLFWGTVIFLVLVKFHIHLCCDIFKFELLNQIVHFFPSIISCFCYIFYIISLLKVWRVFLL